MDPITLAILAAVVFTAIAIVIELIVLTIEWLTEQFQKLRTGNKDEVGFTIRQAIEKGEVEIIQGVFNKETNKIVAAQKIKSQQLDATLKEAHNRSQVIVYT